MKTRIISGAVGLALLTVILVFRHSIFFTVAIGILSLIGVNEVLHAIKIKSMVVLCTSLVYAAAIPYVGALGTGMYFKIVTIAYVAILLIALVVESGKLTFSDIASSFVATLFISYAFSTLVYLRDLHHEMPESYSKNSGLFLILLVLVCAWGSDTGAYFAGSFLGKHKLAPTISPKKTVEGLIGGILSAVALTAALIAIFNAAFKDMSINYPVFLLLAVTLSIIGVFGDLAASVIKRNHDIKDFGKIMPGHGGVMDRFDSVLLISPVLYGVALLLPNLTMI